MNTGDSMDRNGDFVTGARDWRLTTGTGELQLVLATCWSLQTFETEGSVEWWGQKPYCREQGGMEQWLGAAMIIRCLSDSERKE